MKDILHLGGARKPSAEEPNGDIWTYAPPVWDYFVNEEHVKTVLDVGCGYGYSAKYFEDRGCEVLGLEAHPNCISEYKGKYIINHDFTIDGLLIDKNLPHYDLCWCCEFVEHVEDKFKYNILSAFDQCKTLAMTHALPGQVGTHHVNCRESSYWIDFLIENGWTWDVDTTAKLRSLVKEFEQGHYFWKTGLVFRNQKKDRQFS